MAAATSRLPDCTACFRETKYGCIICFAPMCTLCAKPEKNDRTDGRIVAKRVGYCGERTEALGLPGKHARKHTKSKRRSANPSVVLGWDMVRCVVIMH